MKINILKTASKKKIKVLGMNQNKPKYTCFCKKKHDWWNVKVLYLKKIYHYLLFFQNLNFSKFNERKMKPVAIIRWPNYLGIKYKTTSDKLYD